MRFLRSESGTVVIEYLVLAALVVGVLGLAVYGLFGTLKNKVQEVNNSL